MKCLIVSIIIICTFSPYNFGQILPEWVLAYNGLGITKTLDKCNAMAIDLSGNIYVTGESYGLSDNLDYLTIKINPAGDTLWTRRYNGTGDSSDVAIDIAVDALGNAYVTGRSFGDTTNWDYTTIKYNSAGDLEWVDRFSGISSIPGGFTQDLARAIYVDGSGYSYVTGVSTIDVNTSDDILTIKYSPAGAIEWANRYNGPLSGGDQANKIKVDGLGNVYVAGFVDAISTSGTRDFCTIKYNSAGLQEWLVRYDGPDNKMDEARLLDLDGLGNIYVCGVSTSNTTNIDYLTVKYNPAGIEQWTARYSYSTLAKEDRPRDMVVDAAGNCYITGMSRSDQNWAGFSTVKYSTTGTELWANRYDPFHTEDPYGIALDNLGNIYVSGESNGDMYTIGYNSLGSELGNSRFTNPGLSQEFVSDIVVDTSSAGSPKVYVSGSSENAVQDANYIVLKYSSITGIEDETSAGLNSFYLMQNYPNPFNPSTKIRYSIPSSPLNFSPSQGEGQGVRSVQLKIFDVLGNKVATIVNEEQPAGSYEVEFNAAELASGIYFYKLQAGSFVETKKMILIK